MVFWPSRLLSLCLLGLVLVLICLWDQLAILPPLGGGGASAGTPDLIAERVHALRFDKEGRPTLVLSATTVRHLPLNDTMLFDEPLLILEQTGRPKLFIHARHARAVHRIANIWLEDQVILRRESDGKQGELLIQTQNVLVNPDLKQATSSSPVAANMGHYHISAIGFTANQQQQTLDLKSNVRIRYVPQNRVRDTHIMH